MDRLRRSLRESFRKKKDHVPECSKPHQWQADEGAVRDGTCSFPVKYLGCVEVFESRGMQVCEDALKMLRNSRRRSIRGVLYVTGDGLRVVDDDTKGLIVDQTIEKVSFCAPDRNHEKGFSYICRDGTTRRWMCHGFLAVKDSGERLSHAVGCAFAACLERKQKRDKECGVTMTFDPNNSTFTRMGSFKQTTMTERMQQQDSLESKQPPVAATGSGGSSVNLRSAAAPPTRTAAAAATDGTGPVLTPPPLAGRSSLTESVPAKPIHNPYAIERPHATPMMLQRQGSFRGFGQLNQTSPFKRQLSLRITDLPSNLERQQRSMSLESSEFSKPTSPVSPIPESSPVGDRQPADSISAMCQQLSRGLNMLSNDEDVFSRPFGPTPASAPPTLSSAAALPSQVARNGIPEAVQEPNPWAGEGPSRAEAWLASNVHATSSAVAPGVVPSSVAVTKSASNPLDLFASNPNAAKGPPSAPPVAQAARRLPPHHKALGGSVLVAPPRRAPHISHSRSQSLGAPTIDQKHHPQQQLPAAATRAVLSKAPSSAPAVPPAAANNWSSLNGNAATTTVSSNAAASTNGGTNFNVAPFSGVPYRDPFDAEWAELAARTQPSSATSATTAAAASNPFSQNTVKTFEIHM